MYVIFNTYVVKVFRTPISGQGGSIWTQHQKHTFQNEFCIEIWVTGRVLQKTQTQQKNRKSDVRFQNGGQ